MLSYDLGPRVGPPPPKRFAYMIQYYSLGNSMHDPSHVGFDHRVFSTQELAEAYVKKQNTKDAGSCTTYSVVKVALDYDP